MELKDFVKQALTEITLGVKEAQEECSKSGAIINPLYYTSNKAEHVKINGKFTKLTTINFNVAITSSEGSEDKKGLSVLFNIVSFGGSRTNNENIQNINSINFSIPLVMPYIDSEVVQKNGIDVSML